MDLGEVSNTSVIRLREVWEGFGKGLGDFGRVWDESGMSLGEIWDGSATGFEDVWD